MGFFNDIKNKIITMLQRSKTKKLNEPQGNYQDYAQIEYLPQPKTFSISDLGDYAIITSIRFNQQIAYNDGTYTNLMIAKIQTGKKGEVENLGKSDSVAFEIPMGVSIDDCIVQKTVSYYLQQKSMPDNRECMYIGRINNNPEDYTINKDQNVEDYVKNQISEDIRRKIEAKEIENNKIRAKNEQDRIETEKEQKEKFRESIAFDLERRNKELNMEKEKRRQNYYISSVPIENGENCEHYNGVNVLNGDILRIRNLNKVSKDKNGTYIYTGYIESTTNSYDVEVLSSEGIPVCFTTDRRVEDIVKCQDPNETYNLLKLLSQEDNFKNNNGYLNFIGSLNRGEISNKGKNVTSTEVQEEIARLQRQFYQRKISDNQQIR